MSPTRWATPARSRGWCSTPRLRSALALLALVLAALSATLFRSPPGNGPFARDFEAYYAAGATWNAGGDPWSRDVWAVERTIPGVDATRDELLPFVGPAAALPLWSLFARLPFDVARAVWLAVLGSAFVALVLAAQRLAGVPHGIASTGSALIAGIASGPAISALSLGQVALVAAAAVAVTFVTLTRGSAWSILGACVAALQPNLALPLAVRLTRRRDAALLVLAGIVFFALSFAFGGGPAGFVTYLQRLAEHGASERFILIQYSIPAILVAFAIAPASALAIGTLTACGAAAIAAYAAVRLRARPILGAATATALLPFAVPFFHEHDFVIELIPVLILGATANPRTRATAGIGAVCVLVDWLGAAQHPHTTAHTLCLAFAVACALLAYGNRMSGAAAIAPLAACAAVAAFALPLARAFAAPVWPDLLGAFHAAPGLDAGAVWAAEQQRAGLTAIVPAWGVLRAIPLAGCALLAAAGLLAAREPRVTVAA